MSARIVEKIKGNLDVLKEEAQLHLFLVKMLKFMKTYYFDVLFHYCYKSYRPFPSIIKLREILFTNEIIDLVVFSDNWDLIHIIYSCFSCLRNNVLDDQEVSTSQFEKLIIIFEFFYNNKYRLIDNPLIEKKNSYEHTTANLFEGIDHLQMDYFFDKKKTGETLLIKNIKKEFDFKESSFLIAQKIIEKNGLSKLTIEEPRNYISLLFHIKVLKQLDSSQKDGFIILLCDLLNQVLKEFLYEDFNGNKFLSKDFTYERKNFSYFYLMLDDIDRLLGEESVIKLLETFVLFDRNYYGDSSTSSEMVRSSKLQYSQALLDYLIKKLAKCQKNEPIIGLIICSFELISTYNESDFKLEDSIAEQVLLVFNELIEKTQKNIFIEKTFIESNPDVILACVYYFSRIYSPDITKKYMEHVKVFWQDIITALLAKDETIIENQLLYQTFFYYIIQFILKDLKLNQMYKGSLQVLFEKFREKIKGFKNTKISSIFNISVAVQFSHNFTNFEEFSEEEKDAFILLMSELNLLGFFLSEGYLCNDYLRTKLQKYDDDLEEIKKDEDFFKVLSAYLKAMFNSKAIYNDKYLMKKSPPYFKDFIIEEFAKYLTDILEPILIQEQELIKKLILKSEVSFVEKNVLIYLSKKTDCYSKDVNFMFNYLHDDSLNYKDYKIIFDFMRKSLTPIVNFSAKESDKRTCFFFIKFEKNEKGIKTNTKIVLQNLIENFSDFEKAVTSLLELKLENDFFIDRFHKYPKLIKVNKREKKIEIHAKTLNNLLVYFSKIENKEEIYNHWKIVKEFEFDLQFLLDTIYKDDSYGDKEQECLDEAKRFFNNFTSSKIYYNILMRHSKEFLPFYASIKNNYVKNGNFKSAFSCSDEENIFKPFFFETLNDTYYYKTLRSGFSLFKDLFNFGFKIKELFPNKKDTDFFYYEVLNSLANHFLEDIDKLSDEERFIFCVNVNSMIFKLDERLPVSRYPQLLHFFREGTLSLSRLIKENNITEDVTKCKETNDKTLKNIILYYVGKNFCYFIRKKIIYISFEEGHEYFKYEDLTLKEVYDIIDNEYVPICQAMLSMDVYLRLNDTLSNINYWIPYDIYCSSAENEKPKLAYFAFKMVHPFLKTLCIKQIERDESHYEYLRMTVKFFTKFNSQIREYGEKDSEDQLKQYAQTRCGLLDILQNILNSLNINFKLTDFAKIFEESYLTLGNIKYDGPLKFDIEGLSVNCKINLFLNLFAVLTNFAGYNKENPTGGVESGRKTLNSSFNFRFKYLSLVKELIKLIVDNKNEPYWNKSAFYFLSYPLNGEFVEVPQELNENWEELYKLFIEYSNFLRNFHEFRVFKNNHCGTTFKNVLNTLLQILNKLEKGQQKQYLTKCYEVVLIILDHLKGYEIEKRENLGQERFSLLILILKSLKFFDRKAAFCSSSIEILIKNCFIDKSTGKIKESVDNSTLINGLEHHEKLHLDTYCKLLINLCQMKKTEVDNKITLSLKNNIGTE